MKMNRQDVFLIGLMGSGKTSLGHYLAQKLKMKFYDSDSVIEEKAGAEIAWIFDVEDEARFREREKEIINGLTQKQEIVLATGGGVVIDPENRRHLNTRGIVIYLQCSVDQLLERTHLCRHRPLLLHQNPRDTYEKLLAEREPFYREIADLIYNTSNDSISALGDKILQDLHDQFGL